MSPAVSGYISILTVLGVVTLLGAAILVINRFIGPRRTSEVKQAPFECGSDPIGTARHRFSVKFYLVAIFFIVFDIEIHVKRHLYTP